MTTSCVLWVWMLFWTQYYWRSFWKRKGEGGGQREDDRAPPAVPSPPTLSPSQHWGLFTRVSSSHQVAKVLEFQLQAIVLYSIFEEIIEKFSKLMNTSSHRFRRCMNHKQNKYKKTIHRYIIGKLVKIVCFPLRLPYTGVDVICVCRDGENIKGNLKSSQRIKNAYYFRRNENKLTF